MPYRDCTSGGSHAALRPSPVVRGAGVDVKSAAQTAGGRIGAGLDAGDVARGVSALPHEGRVAAGIHVDPGIEVRVAASRTLRRDAELRTPARPDDVAVSIDSTSPAAILERVIVPA